VIIVILAGEGAPAPADAAGMGDDATRAQQPEVLPPLATESPPASQPGTETAPVPVTLATGGGNPTQE
jgi:hypothetical protein